MFIQTDQGGTQEVFLKIAQTEEWSVEDKLMLIQINPGEKRYRNRKLGTERPRNVLDTYS